MIDEVLLRTPASCFCLNQAVLESLHISYPRASQVHGSPAMSNHLCLREQSNAAADFPGSMLSGISSVHTVQYIVHRLVLPDFLVPICGTSDHCPPRSV